MHASVLYADTERQKKEDGITDRDEKEDIRALSTKLFNSFDKIK